MRLALAMTIIAMLADCVGELSPREMVRQPDAPVLIREVRGPMLACSCILRNPGITRKNLR